MREILFRGKRLDDGEWVEGSLISFGGGEKVIFPSKSKVYMPVGKNVFCSADCYDVDPNTVGQFTGLTDENGKRIFEGDIIKTRKSGPRVKKLRGYYGYDSEGYPQKIPGYDGISEYGYYCQIDCYAKVEYNAMNGGFHLNGGDKFVGAICNEVAGNIHDNPELLGGGGSGG